MCLLSPDLPTTPCFLEKCSLLVETVAGELNVLNVTLVGREVHPDVTFTRKRLI